MILEKKINSDPCADPEDSIRGWGSCYVFCHQCIHRRPYWVQLLIEGVHNRFLRKPIATCEFSGGESGPFVPLPLDMPWHLFAALGETTFVANTCYSQLIS